MYALDVEGMPLTEIQDAGYHLYMDDVGWAPPDGWSPRGAVELIEGHIYVVWTRDDHYAKFRVTSLAPGRVIFDWAYQTAQGNQELKTQEPVVPAGTEGIPLPPPRKIENGARTAPTGGAPR